MAGNRKAAQALILNGLKDIDPSGVNVKIMTDFFSKMDDNDFDRYMTAIEEKKDYIPVVMENLNGVRITTRNNLEVAKKWGHEFFQRIWVSDPVTGHVYLTGPKYLVIHLPVRRQIQTLLNKISTPEDNKHIDEMTDQPTGVSKGSSMSFPEILVLYSQGFDKAILEMIKYRGGDIKLMNEMDKRIRDTGGVRMESLKGVGGRVKSTTTLSALLKGMHLDNNF